MFDCGYKSQYIGGQREKFVRLDDSDSTLSFPSNAGGKKKCRFNLEGLPFSGRGRKNNNNSSNISNNSKSFRMEMKRGSEGLLTFGRSLKTGVTRAVFPEDLKVSEKMIFDPQDRSLLLWNRLFVISCIISVSVDPLFLYLPVIKEEDKCFEVDAVLAATTTILRTIIDAFYLIRMGLQFRTAFIAPSSRVFGRGELVIDPAQIAARYLHRYFIVDFLSILPVPQIIVWYFFLKTSKGSGVLAVKQSLLLVVFTQYIPRFVRFIPLTSELKKTAGAFAESAWAGAAYYLLWYMLASHVAGSFWYLLAVERNATCWHMACADSGKCDSNFLYCDNKQTSGYQEWIYIRGEVLNNCTAKEDDPPFDYGIYTHVLSSGIVASRVFFPKFCFCLWWGLQNLSTLGQGLETSTYPGENLFSISITVSGLVLFALLIGNMQTYLQSLTIRLEEMRIKRRDSEQWMHHRSLPNELRERVRRYDQYKWLETRGVNEESLVQSLPKDLRRDIKRHLCLNLVRRVPLFANMDERLLTAICERLKPSLYTERTYIVREGDPVNEMLFIIRGRLESVTTDGGRSGFFNKSNLQEGDFCGEELLTWALDPKAGSNLPSSTRTVKASTEVEAFALEAEELKFVASQFRRLHSRQVQHTFRFYSQQWRTWAACFIQAAWRRYSRRKNIELHRREEEEEMDEYQDSDEDDDYHDERSSLVGPSNNASTSSLGATMFVSRFAANLRVHKFRGGTSSRGLAKLQKPPEPDFDNL